MRVLMVGLFLAFSALGASQASAQVRWESPLLVGPGSPGGLSLFLVDPGEGLGAMGQWQGKGEASRLGFRVGLAETHYGDLAVFGGVDFTGPLYSHSDEFPLDVIWVTGVGMGVAAGDYTVVTIPLGVSVGREVIDDDVWFHPYIAPRLVIDAFLGDADPHSHGGGEPHYHSHDDKLELGFVLDLGADFSFTGSWALRIGASVGDRRGLAVGISFPTGR
jgi:hypothetical protein